MPKPLIQTKRQSLVLFSLLLLSFVTWTEACTYQSSYASQNNNKVHINNENDGIAVDSLLQTMTLQEKIGQLFVIRAYGYFKNRANPKYQKLISRIQNFNIGGIIFSNGTVCGQATLTNSLQRHSEIPLWITQDTEFGVAMRVEDATRIVPAMGIAATQDPEFAYLAGQITANEAKALGVNQIFAPVLDVNNNPNNPVINVRSFSSNPDTVARYGLRFMYGARSQGVIPTIKHFPGHGDTDTDSHLSLPVIPYDYSRLDSVELVPFKAAIEAGAPSVLSAHISFPEISNQPGLPGTLDPSILHRILKDSLNFDGLVVTDGLEMKGISEHYSPGEAVVLDLKAGADLMLLSSDEVTAIEEVERAVQQGKKSEKRINQSVRKLLNFKKDAGLFQHAAVDISALNSKIASPKNKAISDKISRRSLVLLKNEDQILPVSTYKFPHILVLSIADTNNEREGNALVQTMRRYHPNIRHRVFNRSTSRAERKNIIQNAHWADLIVLDSRIGIRSDENHQIKKPQRQMLANLPKQTPKVLIALDNPYAVTDIPEAEVQLIGWDDAEHQLENIAPALFGASAINGHLPINIPHTYKIG